MLPPPPREASHRVVGAGLRLLSNLILHTLPILEFGWLVAGRDLSKRCPSDQEQCQRVFCSRIPNLGCCGLKKLVTIGEPALRL